MKYVFPFFSIIFMFSVAAYAGAWTQKKGKGQLISSANSYIANQFFDSRGKRIAQEPYYKNETSHYFEYGLRDDITVGGRLALVHTLQEGVTGNNSLINLGDMSYFARKDVWHNQSSVISLQPFITFPSPDGKNNTPKIGSDDISLGLSVNAGRGFEAFGRHHFVDGSLGYNHRFGLANDQLLANATLGFSLTERWGLMPQIFITHAMQKSKVLRFTQSSADDYDLTTLQLSALYYANETFTAQVGVYSNVMGKNTGAGSGVIVSWWTHF